MTEWVEVDVVLEVVAASAGVEEVLALVYLAGAGEVVTLADLAGVGETAGAAALLDAPSVRGQ